MISYMKRAREYKEFLLKETEEFERGKRHLANMMGIKSDQMTQADIDDAIRYLFPSGLFDKRARPIMRHPDLLYKAQKDAQFDIDGRPYHYLFYTSLPNYYEALISLRNEITKVNDYEDEQLSKGILDPPPELAYELEGRSWISYEKLCDKFIEKFSVAEYEYFLRCLQKLADHPYSGIAKEFLDQYNYQLAVKASSLDLPEIKKDETTGQIYTEMVQRKREHRIWIKTVLNGSGKIDIDGHDILYFTHPYLRTNLLMPLRIAGLQDKVDIFAKLIYQPVKKDPMAYGQSAVAFAIRLAVSKSVAAFSEPKIQERLRLAGLLDQDLRLKERKKFGQMKARRKYTWKKR